jgi:hypothetical protein
MAESPKRIAAPVDLGAFSDPAAQTADWTPVVRGGSNFGTHHLVELDADRIAFKKTIGYVLFGLVFLLVGLGCSGGAAIGGSWLVALFGIPFAAIGAWILWPRALVFDARRRTYAAGDTSIAFDTIQALQLLKERVSGDDSDYDSYELNLVLRDGKRVNVVDHGNLKLLRADAQQVRLMLGCPLWDGTHGAEE